MGYQSADGTWVTDASYFDTSLDNEANKTAGYWGATTDPIKEAATSGEGVIALDPTAVALDKKPIRDRDHVYDEEGTNITYGWNPDDPRSFRHEIVTGKEVPDCGCC